MHGRHDHPTHKREYKQGHNGPAGEATQWQTPHLPHDHVHENEVDDADKDLDLVETAFCEAFAVASDPTSFLRLAGVPFTGMTANGRTLNLLRVEHQKSVDIGSLTPHVGGGSFRYAPLPETLTSRRDHLRFMYFDGDGLVPLSLNEAKALGAV